MTFWPLSIFKRAVEQPEVLADLPPVGGGDANATTGAEELLVGADKEGSGPARPLLVVPETVVFETWRALQPSANAGCEGVVLWAVPKLQDTATLHVVTSVIVPLQRVAPGRYEILPEGVRMMGKALRRHGLVNVAQVHTHPGRWVDHSPWDDTHSFSLRDGAVSIVWPEYGRVLPVMDLWGVHVCRGGKWQKLDPAAAGRRLVIAPFLVDLRLRMLRFEPSDVVVGEVDGA